MVKQNILFTSILKIISKAMEVCTFLNDIIKFEGGKLNSLNILDTHKIHNFSSTQKCNNKIHYSTKWRPACGTFDIKRRQ